MVPAVDALPFANRVLHFVGVGGAGMSGLALVSKTLGARVSGSDRSESAYTAQLRTAGIEPAIGHDASNLPPGAETVISTAIPEANPELAAARAASSTVLHRSELLGEIARLKRAIAVSGTHGKTTTTGMIVQALASAGRDPAYLVGAQMRSKRANAAWGEGEWIVIEADESDRSMLNLPREVALVLNAELDHHATYRSLSELREAFEAFAAPAKTRIAGPGVTLEGSVTFGIDSGDLRAEAIELRCMGSRFSVEGIEIELAVPGRHNVLNALAALAACRAAGVEPAEAAPGLGAFEGAGRRFEERGRTQTGARVFDDYAHHPTEVRATLEAARTLGADRVVACFQPHLYSRTRELAREFGLALALADIVVVLDVYPAREKADDFPGVSGLTVARKAADSAGGRAVWWLPTIQEVADRLVGELTPNDVVLTLGAGDVDRLASALIESGAAS